MVEGVFFHHESIPPQKSQNMFLNSLKESLEWKNNFQILATF